MAKGVIGFTNRLKDAVLTTNSETASLPVTNIVDDHRAIQWRSNNGAGQFFDADFGSSIPIGAVSLHGVTAGPIQNPGDPLSGNWRVRLGATQGSGSVYDSASIGLVISKHFWQAVHVLAADLSARWLRVDLPDGVFYVGLAFAGPTFRPTRNFSYQRSHGPVDPSIQTPTRGGQLLTDVRDKVRAQEFELKALTIAEIYDQTFALEYEAGRSGNVLFVPDYEDATYRNREAIFGTIADATPAVQVGANERGWAKRYRITERL